MYCSYTLHNCLVLKPKITLICFNSLCHSLSFVVPLAVILCHSLLLVIIHCHSLSFVVTRCHLLSLVATRCSLVVTPCVTRCHLLSLVVIHCTTHCYLLSLAIILCHLLYHSLYHSPAFLLLLSIVIFESLPFNWCCFLLRY